jgi:hypothetical protein
VVGVLLLFPFRVLSLCEPFGVGGGGGGGVGDCATSTDGEELRLGRGVGFLPASVFAEGDRLGARLNCCCVSDVALAVTTPRSGVASKPTASAVIFFI